MNVLKKIYFLNKILNFMNKFNEGKGSTEDLVLWERDINYLKSFNNKLSIEELKILTDAEECCLKYKKMINLKSSIIN